jgi:WD40 repeat protein
MSIRPQRPQGRFSLMSHHRHRDVKSFVTRGNEDHKVLELIFQDYVLSVAISPDGQWVVSGSKDRAIQFWNMASGQAQFMLQGHKNSVISIDLARSGGHLASGSGDCQARIWKYDAL